MRIGRLVDTSPLPMGDSPMTVGPTLRVGGDAKSTTTKQVGTSTSAKHHQPNRASDRLMQPWASAERLIRRKDLYGSTYLMEGNVR